MLDEAKQKANRKLKIHAQLDFPCSNPTSDVKSTPDPSIRHKLQPKKHSITSDSTNNFRSTRTPQIYSHIPRSRTKVTKTEINMQLAEIKTLNSRINVDQHEIIQI